MKIDETLESGAVPIHTPGEAADLAADLTAVEAGLKRLVLFEFKNLCRADVDLNRAFAAVLLANAAIMVRSHKPVVKLLHTSFDAAAPGWARRVFPFFNAARAAMTGGFADLRNINLWMRLVADCGDGSRGRSGAPSAARPDGAPLELENFLGFFKAVGLSPEAGVQMSEAEFAYGATGARADEEPRRLGAFSIAGEEALSVRLTLPDRPEFAPAPVIYDQYRDFGSVRLYASNDRERSRLVFDFAGGAEPAAEIPPLLSHLSDFDLLRGVGG